MKPYRGTLLTSAVLLSILPLFGCGDADEGGSNSSGSYIRVLSVSPTTIEPDVILTQCSPGPPPTYEPGITNYYTTVAMKNESAPTTPEGSSTNSRVTMNRYRVEFTGVSKSVNIPSIDEGGQSVGLSADGTQASMTVLVWDFATRDYVRSHYPSIGHPESLTLRAKITLWGTDSFENTVSATAEATLVVTDYNRCTASERTASE